MTRTGSRGAPGLRQVHPVCATLWHDEATVLAGNPLTTNQIAGQAYRQYTFQDPPADGDTFEQTLWLAQGDYIFSTIGVTFSQYGKIDWYLDGQRAVEGQDWYSAGTVNNVIKTATVRALTSGTHTLRGVVNGKNGSASGYFIVLTKYWFRRT